MKYNNGQRKAKFLLTSMKDIKEENKRSCWQIQRMHFITHHHGQTLPAGKRNQTIAISLTDYKHEKKE